MKEFILQEYRNCMTIPEYNSRLVFLVSSAMNTLAGLAVVIMFFFAHDKASYAELFMAVTGGGLASGIGRFLTKKAGAPATPAQG